MNLECRWNHKMEFTASAGSHPIRMDAKPPLGDDTAPTPKQLLLAAICGCTAMDVVALLKKYRQPLDALEIRAEAQSTEGVQPAVFKEVRLQFLISGQVDPARALESVRLSQSRYCGVSAMVAKTVPIFFSVVVNEQPAGEGRAEFAQGEPHDQEHPPR